MNGIWIYRKEKRREENEEDPYTQLNE